ncbi:MAG: DUF4251 domain-containing protein [Alistipes sp.]|nr:DUF4251 domain-containing protein [Alistipes sp.]
MKRFFIISICVAISCGALIGQTRSSQSASSRQQKQSSAHKMSVSPSSGDYREELRNEKREEREKRRADRLAEYTKYMDSLVLSRNFQFNPQTMQQQPAGSMRVISNPNFSLSLWDATVDICLPYIKGYTPPYRYVILNYTLPSVNNLLIEQTHEGWSVSFNTSLYSAQTYTFTLEIFSNEGGANLTISSPWYNAVQYSGTISALY